MIDDALNQPIDGHSQELTLELEDAEAFKKRLEDLGATLLSQASVEVTQFSQPGNEQLQIRSEETLAQLVRLHDLGVRKDVVSRRKVDPEQTRADLETQYAVAGSHTQTEERYELDDVLLTIVTLDGKTYVRIEADQMYDSLFSRLGLPKP